MNPLRTRDADAGEGTFGRRRFLRAGCLLLGPLALPDWRALAQDTPAGEQRSALVIGNANYAFGRLRNPVNDARLMAESLRSTGFDVTTAEDASLSRMLDSMKEFVARARTSQVRLFYYAGHGIQSKGNNYLVPVDATTLDDDKLATQLVNAGDLVDRLTQLKSGVNIVVLDACRTGLVGRRRGRNLPAGLAQMNAPRGTLIAFSTSPGSVALDGKADNSAYTRHLARQISVPGLPVEQLFKRVRIAVAEETAQAQIPWESSSLMGDFCFRGDPTGRCVVGDAAAGGAVK